MLASLSKPDFINHKVIFFDTFSSIIYLILGHMRGNKASSDLIDELKMCDSEELETIKRIVDAFIIKKTGIYA